MKNLIILTSLSLCFWSCTNDQTTIKTTEPVYSDTIPAAVILTDAIVNEPIQSIPCDTIGLRRRFDSLRTVNFVLSYKLERVKYYLAIVDRKPSQLKFLRSWIRRAVQE